MLVALLVVAGTAALLLRQAPAWLAAADAPEKADAIIVLGSDVTRATTGASLYRQGFARVVYLTVPWREPRYVALERDQIRWPWFDDVARTLLRNRGVPDDAIRLLGKDLLSTVAEAREAARVLGPEAGTLLVVTSPYHVHRARKVFSDHLPAARILVVASGEEALTERWWTDQESARNVLLELTKLVLYKLGFSFT
ncbi:MAG: YdcF family protein [Burkholderiales bacterium]